MLRFDLAEIIRTPGMRHVYDIAEAPYTEDDVEFVSPIEGRIAVTNTGTMLLIRGPLRTSIAMECSRCLEPVRVPISAELEEEYDLKVVDDSGHRDKVVQIVEDEIEHAFEGKVLRLDVLIRQAALLAAPLQPLCREGCPGIPVVTADDAVDEVVTKNSPFEQLSQYFEDKG